tara:strand:+ start:806 stop:1000 length:195 start_codon:yes stop_codon:yes gene_type:complete
MKEKFSFANVEKVVNPPQKPMDAKRIIEDWFSLLFLKKYPVSNPIKRQPIKLAQNVLQGKPFPE